MNHDCMSVYQRCKIRRQIFKKDFNNLEHAIWQANAIAISTIPGPNHVFIIKVAEGKYKISFNNPIFAVYAIIID